MKIAYICYEIDEKYLAASKDDEDGLLLDFLKQKGLDIYREVWTDGSVDWSSYDVAILKSPWDYIDRIDDFYNWLDRLESYNVRLLNPYKTVRWNSNKHYIGEMAEAGFPVIPAAFIEKGADADISPYFKLFGTDKLIVKPCVSGGSKNTFIATDNIDIQALVNEETFMVQPFMEEIQSAGEWSFLFFGGHFSHCLTKKPVNGDFRVQLQFGGQVAVQEPPAEHLQVATSFVEKYAQGCLYARVDGIVKDEQFLLMELELIEPLLFLFTHKEGYSNYYNALKELL